MKNVTCFPRLLVVLLLPCSLSCEKSLDGSVANNHSQISVTGNVEENEFNYAVLSAWANLSAELKAVCTFGIEYSEDESMYLTNKVTARETDSDGKYTITLNLKPLGVTYFYRSFVRYSLTDNYEYGEVRKFTWKTVAIPETGAVDLGLSVKWAACDLGAKTIFDGGDFFAWGETSTKSIRDFTLSGYKFYDGKQYTKYNDADKKLVLDLSDDAAHAILGGNWRMPTREEFEELVNAYGRLAQETEVANPQNGRNTMERVYVNYQGHLGYLLYNSDTKYSGTGLFIPEESLAVGKTEYINNGDKKKSSYVWWCSNMAGLYMPKYNDECKAEFCYAYLYDRSQASGVYKYNGLKIRPVCDK